MESLEAPRKPRKKSIEGSIVTGRGLQSYEYQLGFTAELLRGRTVLNFGSGYTHIEQQLRDRGIVVSLVNLDVIDEPLSLHNPIRFVASFPISLYRKSQEVIGHDTTKIRKWERYIAGTDNRKYVKYNGRDIPFPDQSFDHVLALWSTYQIPREYKEKVYRELFRVGKYIHIGPIYQVDYAVLMPLAQEFGFEVVACQPHDSLPIKSFLGKGMRFGSIRDYDTYIKEHTPEQRIKKPEAKDSMFVLPHVGALGIKGSTMVLRKIIAEAA